MSVSAATLDIAHGQIVTISDIVVRRDDAGRVVGTYVTLFIPHGLDDAPPASATPEPPGATVEAPATPPPDPTEEAKRLLSEAGLTAPSSPPNRGSGVSPPSDAGAAEGGSIRGLLPAVREAGRYPLLCRRAAVDLGIGNINGDLTPSEEEQLRRLIEEIMQ